jgi:D-cysteine desulfhydrase family pyridoxal phosphate-dependent enzyme
MAYATRDILERVDRFPRVDIIHRPTPLRKLERLSARLGGPEIYIKRDDLTGLAFGGNKSRKLEFIIADMLEKKADVVITWASLQSNWCMQTAAAARTFGIKPILMLFKPADQPATADGNVLLDVILDADIRFLEKEKGRIVKAAQAMDILEEAGRKVRAEGRRPYLVPVGGSLVRGDMDKPLGAISYVAGFAELLEQTRSGGGTEPDFIVHSTGSGGTQAGLVVGARAMAPACRIIGISVSDPKGPFSDDVLEIARAADEALGLGLGILPDDVTVFDEYLGQGYGIVDKAVAETIRLVFQTEGIVLDPVYTAKAMIGLKDLIKTGFFKPTDKVLFLHTGGTPALFPNRDKIFEYLVKRT